MSAAANPTVKDPNLQLIIEMGGDREKGYDPFPPDQYMAFMDTQLQLSPRGHNALAWVRWRILRIKPCGRTKFATDDYGRPLRLKDLAAFFDWDAPAASRVWRELEQEGLVRKDAEGNLWICGTVHRKRLSRQDRAAAEALRRFTINDFPRHIRVQVEKLPEFRQRRLTRAYEIIDKRATDLVADSVFAARNLGDDMRAAVLAAEGIRLRRREKKTSSAPRIATVTTPELSVQELFKQVDTELVQTTDSTLYNEETAPVQDSYPYISTENREYRVSSEETGTDPGFTCEDSLPETEAQAAETEDAEPAAAETAPAENLPVDEERKLAAEENDTVVAYVEDYFQEPLTPTLRAQWSELGPKLGIPATSIVRFLMEKTSEKEAKDYDLQGPSALLRFTRVDLPRWCKRKRAFIARDLEREEARKRATAPDEPTTPEHPAEALIRALEINRTFLEMFPTHIDAPRWQQSFAAARENLEQELGRLLDRVAADPEHPTSGQDRDMIQRVKALLAPKANGAAG